MKTRKFEISEHLGDEAAIAEYLDACMEEGGQELFLRALGAAVKALGVQDVARKAGIGSRSSFYRSLVPTSNPKLATIGSVLDSLGLRLAVVTKDSEHAP